MSEHGPKMLKEKYALHKAPETEAAAKRTRIRTGEKVPQQPESQISNYLARIREILDRPSPALRERGMSALKKVMYDRHVIRPADIPEGYYEHQQKLARERGHGDIEITEEQREQLADVITSDQRSSLDTWIDYLSSPDATYPDWLKYFAIRSILGMGEYDKEKKAFTKRSKGTTKPFPDLNREALAYVLDIIEKKHAGYLLMEGGAAELVKSENFPKLYAWAIEQVTPTEKNLLSVTEGVWVKYPRGSDHMPLVQSLQGHGTGWCTAGESTAQNQLSHGDFYVYYSLDASGKPTIPRSAIRMEGNSIGEVRGIASDQNLDPYIAPVVQEKLKEFPDGTSYEKKSADMAHLTEIEKKAGAGKVLSRDDLTFLYELDTPIEGFGYQKDPRIEELRRTRSPVADMSVVFDCKPHQLAARERQIKPDTKAYIGPLFPGIFSLPIEHLYTSFPEGKIRKMETEIGGMSAEQLEQEMQSQNIYTNNYARSLLDSPDFTTSKTRERVDLVRLTVADLGLQSGVTFDQISRTAEQLGLELCPAEVGPHLRLMLTDQPLGDWMFIAMNPIFVEDIPLLFGVGCGNFGLYLDDHSAGSADVWLDSQELVFRIRK